MDIKPGDIIAAYRRNRKPGGGNIVLGPVKEVFNSSIRIIANEGHIDLEFNHILSLDEWRFDKVIL